MTLTLVDLDETLTDTNQVDEESFICGNNNFVLLKSFDCSFPCRVHLWLE